MTQGKVHFYGMVGGVGEILGKGLLKMSQRKKGGRVERNSGIKKEKKNSWSNYFGGGGRGGGHPPKNLFEGAGRYVSKTGKLVGVHNF